MLKIYNTFIFFLYEIQQKIQELNVLHTFWAHRLSQCCCGIRSGHSDFHNVAVAHVLGTSTFTMLLWRTFWAHRLSSCCCGIRSGHIDLHNVAVAYILCTLTFTMLLWVTYGHINFGDGSGVWRFGRVTVRVCDGAGVWRFWRVTVRACDASGVWRFRSVLKYTCISVRKT